MKSAREQNAAAAAAAAAEQVAELELCGRYLQMRGEMRQAKWLLLEATALTT